jgi:nitroreductase
MSNTHSILEVIQARHSKRAYLKKDVPEDLLRKILTVASAAPSSKNTQPWGLSVVRGKSRDELSDLICSKFDRGESEVPDYIYHSEPLSVEYMQRARECGYGLFELKGIERHDRRQRLAHNRENFTFFGAPVALFFHLPADAERGNFLDLGFFMQNIMLGLLDVGLASCPQFSMTSYSQTIRAFLGLQGRCLVSGMAVGYPDPDAIVNTYIPPRLSLDEYVSWFD